jgi:hypothetical protein
MMRPDVRFVVGDEHMDRRSWARIQTRAAMCSRLRRSSNKQLADVGALRHENEEQGVAGQHRNDGQPVPMLEHRGQQLATDRWPDRGRPRRR